MSKLLWVPHKIYAITKGYNFKEVAVVAVRKLLLGAAKAVGADVFITADYKYHQFLMLTLISILDVGHFESEQFTIDLIADRLSEKIP